jgi:hypothetical protein
MKTYTGTADRRVIVQDGSSRKGLNPRNDLVNHSPDGFNWGYGGSGPAQLALALCCDVLQDAETALRVYQEFKQRFVVGLPMGEGWTATSEELIQHTGISP